ncbi:MAG: hypothetical protein N2F24_03830, partial [Deltaproteobacteria bacterium]
LLLDFSLLAYDENMKDQLPIISLYSAKFASVIRFFVENLLNSGCHVQDNLTAVKKIFLMLNIACIGTYL